MALTFNSDQNETIAAIATAMSEAGIGIIRISGPQSIEIAEKLYCSKSQKENMDVSAKSSVSSWKTHTLHYGYIRDPESGEIIDEVMVSLMRAPRSYTTEDTVEINSHGGIYLLNRILKCILSCGARIAEPGEFTKRAFLNGRLDLTEAEAVMDLISSQNEFARKNSISQLSGDLLRKITGMRDRIIYEIAFIESALDDPENYDLDGYPDHLHEVCEELEDEMKIMLSSAENGQILKEGIRTVIIGRPNAGKSSLLNYLAGDERAIVTNIAGTTRDILNEQIRLNGITLNVTDTAGIRDTEDEVEKIGVRKAREAAEQADLILFLLDSSDNVSDEDKEIAQMVSEHLNAGKKGICLLNKNDLQSGMTEKDAAALFENSAEKPVFIHCSLHSGDGMRELENQISEMFHAGELLNRNEVLLTNMRHKEQMEAAEHAIALVIDSIDAGMSEDFFSIDLMNAFTSLGNIIGESVEDDLVEEIFSKFCLGK